ncbi:MAG: hypothetical protein K8R91_05120 [Phycisphaerae bacterium]|nr:hypothetical protein [Phycisphaerae bacterium]
MRKNSEKASTGTKLPRAFGLGLMVAAALGIIACLWVAAVSVSSRILGVFAALVTLALAGWAAWVIRKIIRWNAFLWIGPYLIRRQEVVDTSGPLDVCFLFVDHFEPDWANASPQEQVNRVRRWEVTYGKAIDGHTDSDGRCPQHTWFSPVALTDPEAMRILAKWPGKGWGEIEYHLHHDPKMNEQQIQVQIREDIKHLQEYGAVSSGRYGFVHGMFALAAGDSRYCNAPNEIDVLLDTGCYADFSFPALGTPAQPGQVNSIYYAKSTGEPKPYDHGSEAAVGQSSDGLLIIPGPMCFGLFSRVLDDADIGPSYPPTTRRICRWLDAHVHVRGRPNWIFISVHSHSAKESGQDFLFGGPMQGLWQALEDRSRKSNMRLHYVTTREAYNIIKAAEAGRDGDPNDYRDFLVPPPCREGGIPSAH